MHYDSVLAKADINQMISRLVHHSVFTLLEMPTPLPVPEKMENTDLLALTYRGGKGYLLARNDGIRVLIEAFWKDRPVLRCALRDRQLDGTDKLSPLTIFPNTDPACNRLPGAGFLAAELSIYSWDPGTYLSGLDVEGTVGHFIADPDHYIWRCFEPATFFKLWEQAFFLGRAPWQTAVPMSGVSTHFIKQAAVLLKELGYHRVDAVPSWYNVARFLKKMGFAFTYGEHDLIYQAIAATIRQFPTLDHTQQSWLVALQNVPEKYMPSGLRLPARWPVTHTNMYWARMHRELNAFSAEVEYDGQLAEKIRQMRACNHDLELTFLHTATNCPCTTTVGASSPAASSPAATAPLERRTSDPQP